MLLRVASLSSLTEPPGCAIYFTPLLWARSMLSQTGKRHRRSYICHLVKAILSFLPLKYFRLLFEDCRPCICQDIHIIVPNIKRSQWHCPGLFQMESTNGRFITCGDVSTTSCQPWCLPGAHADRFWTSGLRRCRSPVPSLQHTELDWVYFNVIIEWQINRLSLSVPCYPSRYWRKIPHLISSTICYPAPSVFRTHPCAPATSGT